jgi:sortase A
MYIPRLGFTWNKPVPDAETARLGQWGNFVVAGHRRIYGDPFEDFPRLRPWFTYRIDKGPYETVPSDIEVIGPVPRTPGYTRLGAPGLHAACGGRET